MRYGLGQMAPGMLYRSLSSIDLNDGRLGALTTGGGSWFHFSGVFREKLCCRKLVLNAAFLILRPAHFDLAVLLGQDQHRRSC